MVALRCVVRQSWKFKDGRHMSGRCRVQRCLAWRRRVDHMDRAIAEAVWSVLVECLAVPEVNGRFAVLSLCLLVSSERGCHPAGQLS